MPRPGHRTHSKRKRFVRVPSGKSVVRYEKKIKGFYKCAVCGKPLAGVPREPSKVPKSRRRPERIYGGYLCFNCLKKHLTLEIINRFM